MSREADLDCNCERSTAPSVSISAGSSETSKVFVIEALRGLAALAVAWFHLTNTYDWDWVRWSGTYGWVGVDVFFVISGFVVPYSILHGFPGYSLRDFPRFLARRAIRLEPPYIASIALVILFWHASASVPGFLGLPPQYSGGQIATHLLYLIPMTTHDWLQPVYWTLAFEFAFYVFAGMTFQFIGRPEGVWAWIGCAIVVFALVWESVLPGRCALFVLGFAVFRLIADCGKSIVQPASAAAIAAIAVASLGQIEHWPTASAGLATAVIILVGYRLEWRGRLRSAIEWLATISYSLYLTHVPIGSRIINLGRRLIDGPAGHLMLSLVALIACVIFAWLFHRAIESPAIRWSRRVTSKAARKRTERTCNYAT